MDDWHCVIIFLMDYGKRDRIVFRMNIKRGNCHNPSVSFSKVILPQTQVLANKASTSSYLLLSSSKTRCTKENFSNLSVMEFKVRKESESLIEKIFRNHERRGVVRGYQMAMLLRSLSPELQYDEEELKEVVARIDEDGTGTLDLDGFSKVTLHFLLKQRRRESNEFSHKQLIGIGDFADA